MIRDYKLADRVGRILEAQPDIFARMPWYYTIEDLLKDLQKCPTNS